MTVYGPAGPVDTLPTAPRTLAGGVLAAVLALLGLVALAYPVVGLAVGATALVTAVALRRRRRRTRPPRTEGAGSARTPRELAGDRTETTTGTTDDGSATACEAAD